MLARGEWTARSFRAARHHRRRNRDCSNVWLGLNRGNFRAPDAVDHCVVANNNTLAQESNVVQTVLPPLSPVFFGMRPIIGSE